MPPSRNPNTYSDIKRVIDAVAERGGGVFKARSRTTGDYSRGAAIHWMQRFYSFRKALQREDAKTRPPGEHGRSPYDDIRLAQRCGCKRGKCDAPEACEGHIIDIFIAEPAGELETREGERITLGPRPTPDTENDPLLADALQVRQSLVDEDDE